MNENLATETVSRPERRFELATNEQARERLDNFRIEVEKFQKEHPEVLGATVYGSMIKGEQAKETSDVDAFLYIDGEVLPDKEKTFDTETLKNEYRTEFLNDLNVTPDVAKEYYHDLRTELLSSDVLDKDINERVQYDHQYKEYRKSYDNFFNENYLNAAPEVQEKLLADMHAQEPKLKMISFPIAGMFHARVGNGIQKYRKSFLEKVTALPDQKLAEDIWKDIYIHLDTYEKRSDPDKKIEIPATLQDAIRVYHFDLYKEMNKKRDEQKISKIQDQLKRASAQN